MDVVDAFAGEGAAVEATVRGLGPADWDRPGLGVWTVAELVAHLVRGANLLAVYLDDPIDEGAPVVDRVGYFAFDMVANAPGVAERSRRAAAEIGVPGLPAALGTGWRASLAAARTTPPDRLLPTFMGSMAVQEYLATRVLELTVHHLDLCRAMGLPAAATAAGLTLTRGILEGLLDGAAPEGLADDEAFVLAATGREAHEDPRLPVLS